MVFRLSVLYQTIVCCWNNWILWVLHIKANQYWQILADHSKKAAVVVDFCRHWNNVLTDVSASTTAMKYNTHVYTDVKNLSTFNFNSHRYRFAVLFNKFWMKFLEKQELNLSLSGWNYRNDSTIFESLVGLCMALQSYFLFRPFLLKPIYSVLFNFALSLPSFQQSHYKQ